MLFTPAGAGAFGNTQLSHNVRPATNYGATVTPDTVGFGAWAQLVSATTYDTYGILININSNGTSTANRNTVIDIGIDPAGGSSYTVVIPYLICGGASTYTDRAGIWYVFPLFIPKGASVAARGYSTVVTAFRVFVQLYQAALNPSMVKKASFVEAIGISDNVGTTLTGGTTNDGSWTLIGATTRRLWYWQFGFQIVSTDTAWAANTCHADLAFGDGTNFVPIFLDQQFIMTSAEITGIPPFSIGCEYPVPAGTNMYLRMQGSGTMDSARVAVYGAGG